MNCKDLGASLYVHTFGAFFGVAASRWFAPRWAPIAWQDKNKGMYTSELISAVGTLFLFIYWPSMNAVHATGLTVVRCVLNTVLSLVASVMTSCFVSFMYFNGKLDAKVVFHASIAGGVAMGMAGELLTQPTHAMLTGMVAGAISTFGFVTLDSDTP